MNDTPSGSQMLARGEKVKDRVAWLLKRYPQCKGDDLQLMWRYYQHYTEIRITFTNFKQLLMAPSMETVRRRRQELQSPEKQALENGEITIEDCQYLPKDRTLRKRHNYHVALKAYYGNGQLNLGDF
jgi:hypothetical protein